MYKYWVLICFLFPVFTGNAQDDLLANADTQVKGSVRTMRVRKNLVFMKNDTLRYGENMGRFMYFFHDNKRITSALSLDNERGVSYRYIYDNDKLTFIKPIDTGWQLTGKRYTYVNGILAVIEEVDNRDSNISKLTFTNTDDSTRIIFTRNSAKDTLQDDIYTYDQSGKVITRKIYNHRKLQSVISLEYDAFNNIVKQKHYDVKGKPVRESVYVYVYDHNHNFTMRTEYRNREPYAVTKRDIVYQ